MVFDFIMIIKADFLRSFCFFLEDSRIASIYESEKVCEKFQKSSEAWKIHQQREESRTDRMCALWEAVGCRVEFTLLSDLVYLLSSSPSLGFETSYLRTFLTRYRSCVCRTVIGTNNFNIYSKLFALSSLVGEGERQKAEPFYIYFLRWYERSRPRPHHHHNHHHQYRPRVSW